MKHERRAMGSQALPINVSGGLGRIGWGALGGLFFAALALFAGALRIIYALARGRNISFEDLHILLFYVGGFVLAGAVVGLLLPLARNSLARYAAGMMGAGAMTCLFVIGIEGAPAAWDEAWWGTWVFSTLLFGILLGRLMRTWQTPLV